MEASAAGLSVTLRRPKPMVTQSKVLSAKGSFSAFTCAQRMLRDEAVVDQAVPPVRRAWRR